MAERRKLRAGKRKISKGTIEQFVLGGDIIVRYSMKDFSLCVGDLDGAWRDNLPDTKCYDCKFKM